MYTIYVNDKPIFLSNIPLLDTKYELYLFKTYRLDEVLHKLRNTNVEGIYIFHDKIEEMWEGFKAKFKIIQGAGGLVENEKNELLFIQRNARWDLPKGKMEKDESPQHTAKREVEEECNIKNLLIEYPIAKSYHVYRENDCEILKKTYWYKMKTKDHRKPKPQLEEGITQAVFVNKSKLAFLYPKMYTNIKELVVNYFDQT